MRCAWQGLIKLLPPWIRPEVDRQGRDTLQEIRIRQNRQLQLVTRDGICSINRTITESDISYILNIASAYSPWAATTMSQGFLTTEGGHRIGICGSAVVNAGKITGFRHADSLCIRVARDFPGLAASLAQLTGSVLILGPPGSGKTTLLRDLIRQISEYQKKQITVVDERKELFPSVGNTICFDTGPNTDILSGCPKSQGIEIALRNMSPSIIAMDEITADEDCKALLHAGWCGVDLLATAHGKCLDDLRSRPIYRMLSHNNLFSAVLVLKPDKTWKLERISL